MRRVKRGDKLKDLIISIFGEYVPVMTDMPVTEIINGEEVTTIYTVVANGAAGLDWSWIAGVALFGIVLYSLFRLLGVFFK